MEYKIGEPRDGHIAVHLNGYSVVDIYYQSERASSPLDKEQAKRLANQLKCQFESEHPVSELDEENFKGPSFDDFLDRLASKACEDDDECCCK